MRNKAWWRRKYPAPPPTPPGMCWETDGSKLVTAAEYAAFSKVEMEAFDRLPPSARARHRQTGEDLLTQGQQLAAINNDRFRNPF